LRDTLNALVELQKIDTEIAELEKSGSENPKRLAELESELGAGRAAVDAERERLAEVEKQKKSTEDLLATDREKVKKWEARLTEQRSTREYTALAREIDIAKKQNTTASEEIVELAKELEAAHEALSEAEMAFSETEAKLLQEMKTIRSAMTQQENKRKKLEETRAVAAKVVAPMLLKRYEAVLRRRGPVLVQAHNGACDGCHLNLPPQLYNQIRANAKIDVCPSCSRMIYAEEAFEHAEEAARVAE